MGLSSHIDSSKYMKIITILDMIFSPCFLGYGIPMYGWFFLEVMCHFWRGWCPKWLQTSQSLLKVAFGIRVSTTHAHSLPYGNVLISSECINSVVRKIWVYFPMILGHFWAILSTVVLPTPWKCWSNDLVFYLQQYTSIVLILRQVLTSFLYLPFSLL